MSNDARDMSGDDACPEEGSLVGWSSFRTPKLAAPISSENVLPLWSASAENQSVSCAFMSPMIRVSSPCKNCWREGV